MLSEGASGHGLHFFENAARVWQLFVPNVRREDRQVANRTSKKTPSKY
jgi:hypothetical protein